VKTVLELKKAFPQLAKKGDKGLSLLAQLARQGSAGKTNLLGSPIDRFEIEELWRLTTGEPACAASVEDFEAQVDLFLALAKDGVLDERPGRGFKFAESAAPLAKELLERPAPPVHESVPNPETDDEGRPCTRCPQCRTPLFYVGAKAHELWCPRDKRSWFESEAECPECGGPALKGWIEEKDGEKWRVHGCRRCGATFWKGPVRGARG
jgi:hypothetical protein